MANVINAITTGTGGLSTTADASGNIDFKSNGTTVASITSSGLNVVGTFTTNGSPINVSGGASVTSISSDLTLTSSSNRVQSISATTSGLNINLPDATTLSTGGPVFVFSNTGLNSFGVVRNGGGTILTISPGVCIMMFLTSNSTAGGTWTTEDQTIDWSAGIPVDLTTSFTGPLNQYGARMSNITLVKLSSSSALIVWNQGTSSRDVYGVIITVSGTTITAGTPTLIYNGSTTAAIHCYAGYYSSTSAMIFVPRASNTVAVPITISGTTITVGTTSSTFGGSTANIDTQPCGEFAPLDSSNGLLMQRTSSDATSTCTWGIYNIIHNGTSAPTIGTVSTTVNYSDRYPAGTLTSLTSTTALWTYGLNGGNIYGRVVTVNGSSAPTLGTAVDSGVSSNTYMYNNWYQATALSSTEVFSFSFKGWMRWTISGTTVTYSTAGAFSSTAGIYAMQCANVNGIVIGPSFQTSYLNVIRFTGSAGYFKGTLSLPKSFYSINNAPTSACVGLDSTRFIAVTSNNGTSTLSAYCLEYIGS